ncbi:tRNA:m4X modification enzyme [Coemansia sp. RSA 2559]|nr:tRNA:m4X modification enzyme [Coemansia sp. RSA 2559]
MAADRKPETPGAGRCSHYVASKRRFCPFTTRGGAMFCREHAATHGDSASSEPRRVLCPYDTSHSVELSGLEKHMRALCNARPPATRPPYTLPDCNVANPPPAYFSSDARAGPNCLWSEEGLARSDARLMLSPGELVYFGAGHTKQPQPNCFGRESIAQILRPVVELYLSRVLPSVSGLQCRPLEELLGMVPLADDFPLDCRSHPLLMSTQNASKHTKHSKHMLQQSSLLRHLDDRGCLDPRYAFVEFGAGKGELSVYVHEVLASKPSTNGPSSIILVDRKNFRQKYTVETASSHRFQRMYIDIRDLDLAKVPELQTTDPGTGAPKLRPVVAYSKHLCGAATDLTIRCLQRYQDAGGSVVGIAIALCCHHRCKYSMYADPAYLSQTLALSAAAGGATSSSGDDSAPDAMWNESRRNVFRQLAAMSSWAINAPHPPQSQAPEKDNGNDSGLHRSGLSFAQRVRAGHAVKRALDLGRLDFVRKGLGMISAELVYFSLRTTSPENLALIAAKIG